MGPQESIQKTYMNISLGKLRKRSDEKDSKAVQRELKDKSKVYERVYQSITGVLESITMKDHEEYGKSWILNLEAEGEIYAVQVQEDSRYGTDLLKRLPRLHKKSIYKFTPYDFTRNGKHRAGLAIEDESGKKIESFFQSFSGNEKDGWKVENLNGFPNFGGDSRDKDDLKIYFTQVTKFLRNYALKHLQTEFLEPAPPVEIAEHDDSVPSPSDGDLPF